MEVIPSNFSYSDDDRKNLERLLDAFGAMVSLEDIATAYCQAERNLLTASNILCSVQGGRSDKSELGTSDEQEGSLTSSSSHSIETVPENAQLISKSKKYSASLGTVSGVIGRGYFRPKTPANESSRVSKPLKLNSTDFPSSELWDEKGNQDTMIRREVMHQDVAEFLYKMLGDGFHLDREIIQDVVGQCGYDVKKSMEKLLNLSESAYAEHNTIMPSKRHLEENWNLGRAKFSEKSSSSGFTTAKREQMSAAKKRQDLEKEVLEALFSGPERIAEPSTVHKLQGVRRSRVIGRVVEGPPKEFISQTRSFVTRLKVGETKEEESEDNFEEQNRASKEYWSTMKEYYRAAVEVFIAGELERAHKLLEEGHFFMKKARAADEDAAQMLIESRNDHEHVTIDLLDFEPKEAMHLLKVQLTSLSGIATIQYLKLIVRDKDEDNNKAVKRKRLIIKLLETESISWSEEDCGRIIVIPVGDINPRKLSFAK